MDARMEYVVSHEAWYWSASRLPGVAAEVGVVKGYPDDGCEWEFRISWIDLGGATPAAKLTIFGDAWAAFVEIPEFFGRLHALGDNATPEAVVGMLNACGFVDTTDRRQVASH